MLGLGEAREDSDSRQFGSQVAMKIGDHVDRGLTIAWSGRSAEFSLSRSKYWMSRAPKRGR